MQARVLIPLAAFILAWLAFQLCTLDLNPLPWIDEVFFASIAKSFEETGRLIPEVSKEMWAGAQVFIYGPIHFALESFVFRFFGFGIFQYRLPVLLAGICTVAATGHLIRKYTDYTTGLLCVVVFLLDPFLNLSMHEGRMDLLTIALMLLSILAFLKAQETLQHRYYFLSGFFSVAALLTSPRIAVVFAALLLVMLLSLEGKSLSRSIRQLAVWAAPVVLLYGLWTIYAFGGIFKLIDYYQNLRESNGEYLGGRWYIPRHEYALIFLTLLSVIYGIIQKRKSFFNEPVLIALISILLFYLIVLDWGPYSTIILPFYYFLLFYSLHNIPFSWKRFSMYPMLLLFLFNLGYFSLKSIQIVSEAASRQPAIAEKFVSANIPPGSKVTGDPLFYYAVVKSGSDYRCFDEFLSLETREKLLRKDYDYDYLIVSQLSLQKNPALVKYFLQNAVLKKVAVLETPPSPLSREIAKTGFVSDMEKAGYNAVLFVRIKEPATGLAFNKF